MIRSLAAVCLAAGLAACASNPKTKLAEAPPPITPLQQYPLKVDHTPYEILLAPHAAGLSANQATALGDLVARWRDSGAEVLLIRAPADGGDEVYRMVAAIQGHLQALGVDPGAIRLVGYAAPGAGKSPVRVGFERYIAEVPKCGASWGSVTHTISNEVDPNFGCASTANLAAMIANPEDIAHPAATGDADAARRETILEKYRTGASTSTAKDDQANGAVSSAVQ